SSLASSIVRIVGGLLRRRDGRDLPPGADGARCHDRAGGAGAGRAALGNDRLGYIGGRGISCPCGGGAEPGVAVEEPRWLSPAVRREDGRPGPDRLYFAGRRF